MSETLALAYFVAYGLFSIALAITILVLAFGESIGTGITMLLCALIVFVLPGIFGAVAGWTFFLIVLLWAWKYRHLFWLLMANIALQFVTLIVLVQLARVATA